MTSQDNLPIWARILLGVPIAGAASDQTGSAVANAQQNVGPNEDRDHEQSLLAFDLSAGKRNRAWRALMGPVPGKLQP